MTAGLTDRIIEAYVRQHEGGAEIIFLRRQCENCGNRLKLHEIRRGLLCRDCTLEGILTEGPEAGMSAPALTAADLAARINEAHALALQHAGSAIHHALVAGELLIQSKAALPHGKWLPWLRERIAFSERTAQAYMRITKRPLPEGIRNGAADLSVRKALAYIATPRKLAIFAEAEALNARSAEARAKLPPPGEWSIEDAKVCAEMIHEHESFFHRHGLCTGDDLCSICEAEAAP